MVGSFSKKAFSCMLMLLWGMSLSSLSGANFFRKKEKKVNVDKEVNKIQKKIIKYNKKKHFNKTITAYNQALALLRSDPSKKERLIFYLSAQGDTYYMLGKNKKAISAFREAAALYVEGRYEPDGKLAVLYKKLAENCYAVGKIKKAAEAYEKGIAVTTDPNYKGKIDFMLFYMYGGLGNMYRILKEEGKAIEMYKKAIDVAKKNRKDIEPEHFSGICYVMAKLFLRGGKNCKKNPLHAATYAGRALEIDLKNPKGKFLRCVVFDYQMLASAELQLGEDHRDKAIAYAEKALQRAQGVLPFHDPFVVNTMTFRDQIKKAKPQAPPSVSIMMAADLLNTSHGNKPRNSCEKRASLVIEEDKVLGYLQDGKIGQVLSGSLMAGYGAYIGSSFLKGKKKKKKGEKKPPPPKEAPPKEAVKKARMRKKRKTKK